jgi:gamma-glutamyltranspeptidase
MVEEDGQLAGVLGTMGGKVHGQIHVQVLLGLLDGRSPQDAVGAPRWIVGGMEIGERDDNIRIGRLRRLGPRRPGARDTARRWRRSRVAEPTEAASSSALAGGAGTVGADCDGRPLSAV